MLRVIGDERQQAYQMRWNTLPYNLNIREYHSPNKMSNELEMTPMYKQAMKSLKVN